MRILNAAGVRLSELSSTVKVELYSQAGVRQSGKNIRVTQSQADCQLELPQALPTGWYLIRAYTGYMMNFDPSGYAVVRIRVVNPSDSRPVPVTGEIQTERTLDGQSEAIKISPDQPVYGLRSRASFSYDLPPGISITPGMEPDIRIIPDEDPGVPVYPAAGVTTAEMPGHDYFPDITPDILQGHVREKSGGKPVAGVRVGLTYTGSNRFDVAETDSVGRFLFQTHAGTLGHEYVLTFTAEPDTTWEILVCPVFDEQPWQPDTLPFGITFAVKEYLQRLITGFQLSRIYGESAAEKSSTLPEPVRKPVFFNPPDRTVRTADYIELANVREVVYEVVPDVNIRRTGDEVTLSVYNRSGFASAYPALIMLDGIPITRHREMLELPPDRISEIEVKNQVYIHGRAIFSAVVNFVSQNRDFAGLDLPSASVTGALNLPLMSENKPSVDPSSVPVHIPILDPVLYLGQCQGLSNRKVEFTTNDRPGTYRIEVSGIDDKGRPVYGSARFEVKSE